MNMRDVLLLYALVGIACGALIVRRAGALTPRVLCEAAVTVPLWPLWAPFALSPRTEMATLDTASRIERALLDATLAAESTPYSGEITAPLTAGVVEHARTVAKGIAAVDELVSRGELDLDQPQAHDGVARLLARRAADTAHLEALLELAVALRTELLLAGVPEQPIEAGADVRARLEGLTAALRDTRELTR